jgi:glycosyltransferase involved in cell wall biosynthesis
MRIVHVSTYDVRGGAARAAYRLHSGLRRLGHDSRMFVLVRESDDPSVGAFLPPMDLGSRLRRRVMRARIAAEFAKYRRTRPPRLEQFSDDRAPGGAGVVAALPAADVVTLHWIDGFVDYRTFFAAVPKRSPVVWRLADMAPFTGGCHYDGGCGRFTEGCGACPQLGSTAPDDLSRRVWRRKEAALAECPPDRVHIVTPSAWMAEQVKRSPLLGRFPLSVIPNGVDTTVFAPRDPATARGVLGLPGAARVVVFVADDVSQPRKGLALLVEALAGVASRDLCLVSIGSGRPALGETGIPHRHLGRVEHRWLSLVYSAADLYVFPSLQDNLPSTVLEAMACGVPVVGFGVGGVSEMVRHGETGLVVEPGRVEALGSAIGELLDDTGRRRAMAEACRRVVEAEYSLERQVQRYSELYESIT